MPATYYDKLGLNTDIVLDWPMQEGTGTVIHDVSKSDIRGDLITGGPGFMWPAGGFYGIYIISAWEQYINCSAADCTELNFTSGDYSIAFWFNWAVDEYTQMVMGKYVLDASGWEVYLYNSGATNIMTVRHNHGGTRSAGYSYGWTPGALHCFSMSRVGTTMQHYRNGVPVTTTAPALLDPGSSVANDLRCGVRYTENQNWFYGILCRPRIWSRALTADEHRQIYRQGNAQ